MARVRNFRFGAPVMLAALAPAAIAQAPATSAETAGAAAGTQNPPTPAAGDGGGQTVQDTEIVVTATRRSEALSSVPISVAAYSQQLLDKQNVRNIGDITRLTPGVALTRSSRTDRQGQIISIRGITSGAGSATVGVYIDETPVQVRPVATNSSNPYPQIFDLERVEILRGPQGTLFGAGSEGGTVRFITPDPSLSRYSMYGRAEVSGTQNGEMNAEAGYAIGGPIVEDKLGFRVSGWARRDGGYVDRVDEYNTRILDKNANSTISRVLRASLAWKPFEALKLTPSVFYQKVHADDTSQFFNNYSHGDDLRNGTPVRQPTTDKFVLPSLKGELDLGPVALTSVTSYLDRHVDSVVDGTFLDIATLGGITTLPPPQPLDQVISQGAIHERNRFFTQEVRLQNTNPTARFKWVVGVFYQKTKQDSDYRLSDLFLDTLVRANPAFAPFGPNRTAQQIFGVPLYQGLYSLASISHAQDRQLAGFAQVDWELVRGLTATAGVRYSDTKFSNNVFQAGTVFRTNGLTSVLGQKAKPVTPKFGLSYKVTSDDLVYVSATKGYRIGGAVGRLSAQCAGDASAIGLSLDPREISPDSVWSYEAGAKGSFANRRITFEGSVYRVDWKNIQSGITLPNCNIPTTANLGDARSQGFDLRVTARPVTALSLSAALGYTDAKFRGTTLGAINPATGRPGVLRSAGQPLGAPPWSVSVSGEYDMPVAIGESYARADFQYQSHDNTALDLVAGADPTIPRAPALYNLDLRAGLRFGAGIDASVFVANVTNEHPRFGTFRETLATPIYHSVTVRPRTVGLTLTFRK